MIKGACVHTQVLGPYSLLWALAPAHLVSDSVPGLSGREPRWEAPGMLWGPAGEQRSGPETSSRQGFFKHGGAHGTHVDSMGMVHG